jgi:hypothetical protein
VLGSVTAGVANHIGHGTSTFAEWAQEKVYHKAIAHGLSQGAMSQISEIHKRRTPCPIHKLTSAQFCGNATYNTTNHSISNHIIRRGGQCWEV